MDGTDPDDPLGGATAALLEYASAVDEVRIDDFVDLFTPDALFYLPDVVGHQAIADLTAQMLRDYEATSHHISNIRLLGRDGDEIQTSCYVYAWHRRRDGTDVEIWGQYRSRLRFDGTQWRFTRHTARANGVRPEGAMGDVARVPRRTLD
jgi:3-phenylpropionate/cinnamic acid dioxygenase small subunit